MTPRLVLLCGLPGAGKSTLARALCTQFDWVHLDRDALRRQRIPEPSYSQREKRQLNQWLVEESRRHLYQDRTVLIDGMTFARTADRRPFASLAQGMFLQAIWLWLDCHADEAKRRVLEDPIDGAKAHSAADRTPGLVDRVQARFSAPEACWHRLDAGCPRDQVLAQAIDILK